VSKFRINEQGFTLMETIIAIAIIGLVITLSFSLLVFGQNYFSNSNTQYGIQNDGRITSSYLSKELRFATDIEIIDKGTAVSEIASDEPYSYFYINDGKLYNFIYENTDYKQVVFGSSISNSNSKFEKVNDETLRIVIESTEDNKNYDIDTEITLENLKLNDINISGSLGTAVKYQTEYIESSNDDSVDEDEPTISIGSPSGVLKAGESNIITYEVTTSNIESGEFLDVSFNGFYTGLTFINNQIPVLNNKATLEINSFTSVTAGDYLFIVEYDDIKSSKIFTVIDAENSYTLIFDSNGGDESYSETALVEEGETLGSLPPDPTYIANSFTGWNTAADGSGSTFDTSTIVNADMTVYAQWEEDISEPVLELESYGNNDPSKLELTFNKSIKIINVTVNSGKGVYNSTSNLYTNSIIINFTKIGNNDSVTVVVNITDEDSLSIDFKYKNQGGWDEN